jgi:hypothetical protein
MQTSGKKSRPRSQKTKTRDDPEQSKRFIEAAKKAGADVSREEFDRAFKKVASVKRPKK